MRLSKEEHTPLEQLGESKLLVKCFVSYCRHHAGQSPPAMGERQVELLFLMLPIFSEHSLVNYAFLKTFYLEEVAKTYLPAHKAAILRHFLHIFLLPTIPAEDKVHALQLLVYPLLAASFHKEETRELLTPDIIAAVINTLLGGDQLPWYGESNEPPSLHISLDPPHHTSLAPRGMPSSPYLPWRHVACPPHHTSLGATWQVRRVAPHRAAQVGYPPHRARARAARRAP